MIDLNQKVVLVTGGSRGIGAFIVRTLASAGAQVVLHYSSSPKAAEQIVAELGADRVVTVREPLEAHGSAGRLWSAALAWRGHVDVLVNNAGVAIESSIDDPLDAWRAAWDTTWQVNVVAPADLCREAILHFRGRGG